VVRVWRDAHPGYQRDWRQHRRELQSSKEPGEIQAEIFTKAIDAVQESVYLLREIQAAKHQFPVYPLRKRHDFRGWAA
jgi:hypothetical protein